MVLLVQRGSAEEAGAVGQTQNLHHAEIAVEAVKQYNPRVKAAAKPSGDDRSEP